MTCVCVRLCDEEARKVVKGIAKLKIHRAEFEAQAAALRETNVVYKNADSLTDCLDHVLLKDVNYPEGFSQELISIIICRRCCFVIGCPFRCIQLIDEFLKGEVGSKSMIFHLCNSVFCCCFLLGFGISTGISGRFGC